MFLNLYIDISHRGIAQRQKRREPGPSLSATIPPSPTTRVPKVVVPYMLLTRSYTGCEGTSDFV